MVHSHYWKIGEITNGIAQGTCKCGAVKVFDAVGSPEFEKEASRLNAEGRRRLGLPGTGKTGKFHKTHAAPRVTPLNGAVSMPAFCNEWQPAVQIKWLEVYAQLHAKQDGG